jgi:thioredoxin 1
MPLLQDRRGIGMDKSIDLQEAGFEQAVLRSRTPVLVDFWAPRCAPCRLVEPVVEQLAEEYAGKVAFFKLNRDENMGVAMRYNIMSIPTVMIFKDGRPYSSHTGFTRDTKKELTRNLDSVL